MSWLRLLISPMAALVGVVALCGVSWGQAGAIASPPLINVRDYGAKGDGQTDDYPALRLAISVLNATSTGTLYLPPGVYKIDHYKGDASDPGVDDLVVLNCSNVTVFGYGATLAMKGDFVHDNYYKSTVQLVFNRCRDLSVMGLTLDGNVDQTTRYPPDIGESHSSGIVTSACTNYVIQDVYCHHFATDGVYLGASPTVADRSARLINVRCAANARQGLSVIQLRTGRFDNCVFEGTGLTNAAGTAIGPYGAHLPTAGVDVEPGGAPPNVDVRTGDLIFRNCVFRNNQGPQFQAAQDTKTDQVSLWDCQIDKGSSPNPDTVMLIVPDGVIANCDMNVDNLFVTRWEGQTTARTFVWGSRIRSDRWGISDGPQDGTGIVEGNTITGTHSAPLSVPFVNLINPHTVFRNNAVFVPAAGLAGDAGTPASTLRGIAISAGNVFRTDAAGPGYFYTDYGSTPVVADVYASGTVYRPGLGSAWDTSRPFEQGQAPRGLPPAIGDTDGDGQVTMSDVALMLSIAAGIEPATSMAPQSWFPNTTVDLMQTLRLATYVRWLGSR